MTRAQPSVNARRPSPLRDLQKMRDLAKALHIVYEVVRAMFPGHLLLAASRKELKRAGFVPLKNGVLKHRGCWGQRRPSRKAKLLSRTSALECFLRTNTDFDSSSLAASSSNGSSDTCSSGTSTATEPKSTAEDAGTAQSAPSSLGSDVGGVSSRTAYSKPEDASQISTASIVNVRVSSRVASTQCDDAGQPSIVQQVLGFLGSSLGVSVPRSTKVTQSATSYNNSYPATCFNGKSTAIQHVQCLGAGSFGAVMLARDLTTDEFFARKAMRKDSLHPAALQSAIMEKELLRRACDCSFVVKLLGTSQTDTHLYMDFPLSYGGDLSRRIKSWPQSAICPPGFGPLPGLRNEEVVFNAACLVLGVLELQYRNIVHRDIKTENIIYGVDGYPLLADLGLAADLGPGEVLDSCAGTPIYMAPEVLELGYRHQSLRVTTGAGHASDWWSLGVVFYEMVAGETPFLCCNWNGGYDHTSTVNNILTGTGRPPLPRPWPEMEEVLDILLDRDPDNRLHNLQYLTQQRLFAGINWEDLAAHRLAAPWKPEANINDLPNIGYSNHLNGAAISPADKDLYYLAGW